MFTLQNAYGLWLDKWLIYCILLTRHMKIFIIYMLQKFGLCSTLWVLEDFFVSGRDLYRATPAVTRVLGFCGLNSSTVKSLCTTRKQHWGCCLIRVPREDGDKFSTIDVFGQHIYLVWESPFTRIGLLVFLSCLFHELISYELHMKRKTVA